MATPILFVAVDTPEVAAASALASRVSLPGTGIKLGLEFFCANGPAGVTEVMKAAGATAPALPTASQACEAFCLLVHSNLVFLRARSVRQLAFCR